MPLESGAQVGPCLIDAAIGAGGMGEVYRATDTNLKRIVAITVLPDSLAGDADAWPGSSESGGSRPSRPPNIALLHGPEPGTPAYDWAGFDAAETEHTQKGCPDPSGVLSASASDWRSED